MFASLSPHSNLQAGLDSSISFSRTDYGCPELRVHQLGEPGRLTGHAIAGPRIQEQTDCPKLPWGFVCLFILVFFSFGSISEMGDTATNTELLPGDSFWLSGQEEFVKHVFHLDKIPKTEMVDIKGPLSSKCEFVCNSMPKGLLSSKRELVCNSMPSLSVKTEDDIFHKSTVGCVKTHTDNKSSTGSLKRKSLELERCLSG